MQQHLAQGHNPENFERARLWAMPGLLGMGAVLSSASDLTVILKACMGLKRTPLGR